GGVAGRLDGHAADFDGGGQIGGSGGRIGPADDIQDGGVRRRDGPGGHGVVQEVSADQSRGAIGGDGGIDNLNSAGDCGVVPGADGGGRDEVGGKSRVNERGHVGSGDIADGGQGRVIGHDG